MQAKTAVITGATSGIGVEIALHLVQKEYVLLILGRSTEKLHTLAKKLREKKPNCVLKLITCDMSSFTSLSKACKEIIDSHSQIDLLILNAGIWNFKFNETEDHIEETLQVNVLAPMFIYKTLFEQLSNQAKVLFTSSGLHQGTILFDDIEYRRNFSGFKTYRQSKLALIMLVRLLAKEQTGKPISYYSVHPGMVNTNLGRNAGWFAQFIFKLFGKTTKKGAETHCYLIDQPIEKLVSGAYYANCKVLNTTSFSYDINEANKLHNQVENYILKHRN